MAELTKYQQTGRVFSDVPQLDFANVRESFKRSQSLTSALDRISSFAFKGAAQETEKVAERFAIDNPLTIDQVKEASKSGVTAEDLVAASGGGKIWQDTVRKMQGEQLRTQLEVVGKQALLDLQTQVDTNQITNMNDVRAKQEAIVNGLRKTLSFSPDSVVRFDTTMGSVTSALYKEAQDKLVKDYKINQQAQSRMNVDNSIIAYRALLKHEDVQSPEMLREIEYALGEQIYRQSAEGGADFALKTRDEFFKRMQEEKLTNLTSIAVSPAFAKDSTEALNKIAKGDFTTLDGRNYSGIFNSIDMKDKAAVRSFVREQFIAINATKDAEEKDKIDNYKTEVNKIELEYYQTRNPKLIKRLEAISLDSNGKAINAQTIQQIKKSGDESDADVQYSDNVIKLKDEVRRGRFDSLEALYERGAGIGVSRKTINKYVASSYLNKGDALVDELVTNYADLSNPAGSKAAKVKKMVAMHQTIDQAYDAQFEYNKLNPDKPKAIKSKADIAAEMIDKKVSKSASGDITSTLSTLNQTVQSFGLEFNANTNLDEYTRQQVERKIKDKATRDFVLKQLEIIDKANN